MIRSVLMVCEGNVCRSPVAAALLAHELADVEVTSAGTAALVGAPVDAVIGELAQAHGIALDSHVARQLDASLVRDADLILTMTLAQCDWVKAAFPSARGKVFRLCEQDRADVMDPYRRHRTVSELAFAQIRHGISQWTHRLNEPQ
jgi:protein-tyrosine phosphatase